MHYSNDAKSRIAAEYVLGLASRPLARAVRRRMRRDVELAAAVRQWENGLHQLADAAPASRDPSDRVWTRIAEELPVPSMQAPAAAIAAVAAPVRPAPATDHAAPLTPSRTPAASQGPVAAVRHWWQNLWLWQGWAVAASAAAVVLGLQTQVPPPPGNVDAPTPPTIAGAPLPPAPEQPSGDGGDALEPAAAATSGAQAPAQADDIALAEPPASVATPSTSSPSGGGSSVVRTTGELAAESGQPSVADANGTVQRRQTRGVGGSADEGADIAAPALVGVLSGTESGGAAWLVRLDRASGALRVRVIAEQAAGADRDFELWAVPKDGGPPRSLGLISGRQDTLLSLDDRLGRSVRQAQVLAVSVEPTGGSTTGGPTGPVRFAGPMLSI